MNQELGTEQALRIEQIRARMKELGDMEYQDNGPDHIEADDMLCELVRILGYGDIADDFDRIECYYE